jgi:thioredoxin-related protein
MKNQKDINKKNIKLFLLVTATQGVVQVNLKKKLNNHYKVTGYMKLGVGVVLLIDTVKSQISKFTKEDMLIFWGWANYIAHNASSKELDQKFKH